SATGNVYHGFTKVGNTYTTFDVAGPYQTQLDGINDSGDVVGTFSDSFVPPRGFHQAFVKSGDSVTIFSVAGLDTLAGGINALGEIVGSYTDGSGARHGYLRAVDGALTMFDYPGASSTTASGINDAGVIVGTYLGALGPTG